MLFSQTNSTVKIQEKVHANIDLYLPQRDDGDVVKSSFPDVQDPIDTKLYPYPVSP